MTLFWVLLAAVAGFGLFHVKYRVQTLEDDLRRLNAAITEEQEQLHVLRAEWAYLNRPDRLQELSERHLALRPLRAEQIGAIDSLPEAAAADGPSPLRVSPK
ncbi:MAG: hypothetical protein R3229_03705 [Alphaproteobacteria bacterium]|nr:hypothetical protein [Alphaproteobacteria bacterium]